MGLLFRETEWVRRGKKELRKSEEMQRKKSMELII